MKLILIGTSYKQMPIELRERFSFNEEHCLNTLTNIITRNTVKGAVILSTCNRVEIYAETDSPEFIKDVFSNKDNDNRNFYIKNGPDAVHHLFRIASGLDSMIVGETEILRQVKHAYILAKRNSMTTTSLKKIFERALFVGKEVRNRTSVGKINPTIAGAAVNYVKNITGDFKDKTIFILGAGQIAYGIAQACVNESAACLLVANRTYERANIIASEVGAEALQYHDFFQLLPKADVIFCATSSPHYLLTEKIFNLYRLSAKPVIVVDLGMPRNVAPELCRHKNVKLVNLDDVGELSPYSQTDIENAETLVMEKLKNFIEKICISV